MCLGGNPDIEIIDPQHPLFKQHFSGDVAVIPGLYQWHVYPNGKRELIPALVWRIGLGKPRFLGTISMLTPPYEYLAPHQVEVHW